MTDEKKRAKNRKWYETHKKQGLCVNCGKPAQIGFIKCEACREKDSKRYKERYAKRLEASMCTQCGTKKAIEGSKLCAECKEKKNKDSLNYYYWRKESGICIRCGKYEATMGRTMCLLCKSDKDEYNYGRERSKESRQKEYERQKQKRDERYANGECVQCGKKKEQGDKRRLCYLCRNKANRREQERRLAAGVIPDTLRGNGEYCAVCRKPVENKGSKLCNRCQDDCAKNLIKARENAPKDNWFHIANAAHWRQSEARKDGYKNV